MDPLVCPLSKPRPGLGPAQGAGLVHFAVQRCGDVDNGGAKLDHQFQALKRAFIGSMRWLSTRTMRIPPVTLQ
jgi:hypothetical protein